MPARRTALALAAAVAGLLAATAAVPAAVPAARAAGGPPVRVAALVQQPDGTVAVRRSTASDVAAARSLVQRLRAQSGVLAADVSQPVHTQDVPAPDPLQGQQWGLTAVRAPSAWAAGDAAGQVVAVVDSGVDLSHPDLAGALVPGYDVLAGTAGGQDQNGHGTHVAGIVAAVAGNGVGGAGVALHARVMPVRVLDASGAGSSADVAAGVVWAVDHGADVVNLSLGGPSDDAVLDRAIAYALGKGVPVVAAAGNEAESGNPVEYPAAVPGVIAVSAVDSSSQHAPFANTGDYVAVSAPGVGVPSTWLGGGYATLSGTSMATPFVAGAAAVVRAAAPGLTPAQVRAALVGSARDLGSAGPDPTYGAGLLDVAAARAAAVAGSTVTGCPVAFDPQRPVLLCPAVVLAR